jgi:hypothetical protein
MLDELDPTLLAAFAQAQTPMQETEFLSRVIERIERRQRRALVERSAMVIAAVALMGFAAPSILETTADAMSFITERSSDYSSLLLSPAGWVVSLLVGFVVVHRSLRTR